MASGVGGGGGGGGGERKGGEDDLKVSCGHCSVCGGVAVGAHELSWDKTVINNNFANLNTPPRPRLGSSGINDHVNVIDDNNYDKNVKNHGRRDNIDPLSALYGSGDVAGGGAGRGGGGGGGRGVTSGGGGESLWVGDGEISTPQVLTDECHRRGIR